MFSFSFKKDLKADSVWKGFHREKQFVLLLVTHGFVADKEFDWRIK